MAEATNQSKIDAAAEKAYADAAATKPSAEKVAKAVEADAPKPEAKAATVKKAVAAPAKKKAAPARKTTTAKKAPAKKTPVKKAPAKTAAAKKPAPKKPAVAAKKAAPKTTTKTTTTANPVTKLKDTIMATAQKSDITTQAKEMAADVQERVKGAYTKATELASEAGEFNKANVDAIVESGKIFFAGAQELVKTDVENGKTILEVVQADAKKVTSVKSPTELFELQGEIARRNFDAAVSFGSKRTEAIVKLYNDAFAPISNRVSVAAEKVTKAA